MAVGETTGPSPALSVCTCVSVTLNGAFTLTLGAVVSVDPVTATLPVTPERVHSGVPPPAAGAVGQVLAGVAVPAVGDGLASVVAGAALTSVVEDVDDVLADDVSLPDPHAVTIRANDAAQVASATEEDIRGRFTVVTLQLTVIDR